MFEHFVTRDLNTVISLCGWVHLMILCEDDPGFKPLWKIEEEKEQVDEWKENLTECIKEAGLYLCI